MRKRKTVRRRGRASAVGFNTATIKRIARMTDRNDHTRAYIAGAKMLGLKALAAAFERVSRAQEREGYLPHGLSEERYGLYKQMMAEAERRLTPEEFKSFHSAF